MDALDNYRGHIPFCEFALHRGGIAERHEGHLVLLVEGGLNGRVVRDGHRPRGTAVECLREGDDPFFPRVERR